MKIDDDDGERQNQLHRVIDDGRKAQEKETADPA